jgi:hypothetical protein
LAAFIEENGIRMSAEWADSNPNMDDPVPGSSHWRCRFRSSKVRGSMTIYFSMGPAHTREPEVAEVLECLALDASGFENARGFADWCGDYGYDTDSRRAERTHRAVARQAAELRRFLGESAYDALLWRTERE